MSYFKFIETAVILISISPPLNALDLKIQCKNGNLETFSISKNSKSESECETFKSHQLECFDTSKTLKDAHLLSFTLPVDSIYRNRSSDSISKVDVEELVELSLLNKMDPYLVTALKFIEDPPINFSKQTGLDTSSYQRIFGRLPIDASGAISAMGCFVKDGIVRKNSVKPNTLNLPKSKELGKVCLLNGNPGAGDNPILAFLDKDSNVFNEHDIPLRNNGFSSNDVFLHMTKTDETDFFKAKENLLLKISTDKFKIPDSCCINVRYDPKSDYKKTINQVRSTLALMHLRDKTKGIPKSINTEGKNRDEMLALKIQGYNGYGVFGSTESVGNSCLKGMNMKNTPVYGAGAIDLSINMLLLNSKFNELIKEKKQYLGIEDTPFTLCENRNGVLELDSLTFSQLQKKYLLKQTNCPQRTFDYFVKKNPKKARSAEVPKPPVK